MHFYFERAFFIHAWKSHCKFCWSISSWQKIQLHLFGEKYTRLSVHNLFLFSTSFPFLLSWLNSNWLFTFTFTFWCMHFSGRIQNTIPNNKQLIQMRAFFRFSHVCSFLFLLINSMFFFIKAHVMVIIDTYLKKQYLIKFQTYVGLCALYLSFALIQSKCWFLNLFIFDL